jgi:hypothetical protein
MEILAVVAMLGVGFIIWTIKVFRRDQRNIRNGWGIGPEGEQRDSE